MKALLLYLCCFGALSTLSANNLQVSDTRLGTHLPSQGRVYVDFGLRWENSWRLATTAPGNYDAAWVFLKYRTSGGGWRHATIAGVIPVPTASMSLTTDRRGAFVYRSAVGTGTVNYDDLQLLWDYAADGVDRPDLVTLRLFAVEMVYVPTASFTLSAGQGQKYYPLLRDASGGGSGTYTVGSENAITIGPGAGNMVYGTGGTAGAGGNAGTLPTTFPKGFRAFYCMKYEVTQQQWVNFFNTLTPAQRTTMNITDASGKNNQEVVVRNGVSWAGGSAAAATTLPNLPVNWVSPGRCVAFLDWAGLRPMTELEFEKVARGPRPAVLDEYAWGSANRHQTAYTIVNAGTATERIGNPSTTRGNVVYSTTQSTAVPGPLRVGSVAGSVNSGSRIHTGAGYYGAMDLSGNVSELTVSVGNNTGRAFTGAHGDGSLASSPAGWPTTNVGYGERGGDYSLSFYYILISEREFAATTAAAGIARRGFRGVRTAP